MSAENRRKVLFIPKWYPDRKQDQNGNFVQQHAYAVSEFSDVIVLFANYDSFSGPGLINFDFEDDRGIPTYRFYYKQKITGLSIIDKPLKLLLYFVCLMRGYRMIERRYGRPDLVHVHVLLRTGLFAWLKYLTDGMPYIITEHWSIYLPANSHRINAFRKFLTRVVVKKAEALHTVSEDLKNSMQNLGFLCRRYLVLPNVVDTNLFNLAENHNSTEPKVRFLHVSNFNEKAKNIKGIFRAIKKLNETRTGFELQIIGFGEDEKILQEYAQQLGLLNRFVFFEGKKESPEVAEAMQKADVFLMFSNFESLPCVLIEALASGLPVIATTVGGIPEMISKEQGILVAPQDENALLQAMDFMIGHCQEFNKNGLRKYAEEKYSYQAVGRQFAALYETVLNTPKKPA